MIYIILGWSNEQQILWECWGIRLQEWIVWLFGLVIWCPRFIPFGETNIAGWNIPIFHRKYIFIPDPFSVAMLVYRSVSLWYLWWYSWICVRCIFYFFTTLKPPFGRICFHFLQASNKQIQVLKGSFFEKQPICGNLLASRVEWFASFLATGQGPVRVSIHWNYRPTQDSSHHEDEIPFLASGIPT